MKPAGPCVKSAAWFPRYRHNGKLRRVKMSGGQNYRAHDFGSAFSFLDSLKRMHQAAPTS